MPQQDKPEWLTVENIYEYLDGQVPLDTIRSWIRIGKLQAFKPGRSYLVRRDDLDKFMDESRTRTDDDT